MRRPAWTSAIRSRVSSSRTTGSRPVADLPESARSGGAVESVDLLGRKPGLEQHLAGMLAEPRRTPHRRTLAIEQDGHARKAQLRTIVVRHHRKEVDGGKMRIIDQRL